MRFICFIFVFLITVLSVKPCSDKLFSVEDDASIIAKTSQKADQSKAEHEDLCSPFCQCSCCSTSTIISAPTSLTILLNVVQYKYTELLPEKVLNASTSIWQPPKLQA